MSYVLLRRLLLPNPNTTGLALLRLEKFWDTVARTFYNTQTPVASGTPFELALNAEVDRWTVRAGKVRVVRYIGAGQVATRNLAGALGCTIALPLAVPEFARITVDTNSAPVGAPDGYVKVFGQAGVPPYQITVTDASGTVVASGGRRSSAIPLEVFGMDTARQPYNARVVDAQGCVANLTIPVKLGAPDGMPFGELLQDVHFGDGSTGGRGTKSIWNFTTKAVETYNYEDNNPFDSRYERPAGDFIDGYLLPDGVTFRTVSTYGGPDVYFKDDTLGGSVLTLDNLIVFHPDSAAEQNGGVLLEVNATALPVSFTLGASTNDTGSFDGLAAGDHEVVATDAAGAVLRVPFTLKLRYGLRWQRDFADPRGVPQRLELWLRDYAGPVEEIKGNGSAPVVLQTDGLNGSLGGQGDVPAIVGTSCELSLRVLPGTLEEVVVNDDRACRCDVYSAGRLQFRGYVLPDIYTAPLLSGLLPISLTATDGLAGLKDVDFLSHEFQRLQGRRPLLNTLLHALSRCDVSLPVHCLVNRRSTEMSDDDAPELAATTERNGYYDSEKDEPRDLHTVVQALAQTMGGTLCQREGSWQVRSFLEVLADAPGRAYRPAGTPAGKLLAVAPSGLIAPLSKPGTVWGWLKAAQQQQVRPGWKSLVGATDAGWLKNAFAAGEVFSDKYAWLENGARLRPIAGWQPGTDEGFPLVLREGGEKSTDYSTQWPLAQAGDTRYLVSPALPLVPLPESCPAFLTVTARWLPTRYLPTGAATADAAVSATLTVAVAIDGQRLLAPLVFTLPLAKKATDKPTVITLPLPAVPTGARLTVLHVLPAAPLAFTRVGTGDYVESKVYGLLSSYAAGDVVYQDAPAGQRVYFQAKRALFAPVVEPGGLPLGTRPWAEKANFTAGNYVTSGPLFYKALRDMFNPVPPLPASGSDTNWLLTDRADIPDLNWEPLNFAAPNAQALVTSIGIELRPRQTTWDGQDNFRAEGRAGTVRSTEVLDVYHPDIPIEAGLFEGNRFAFSRAVALADGTPSTAWARAIDLRPAPLFENSVYDALALREGPSRLLTGIISHHAHTGPRLLDSVDTPYDVRGRRFGVASTSWNLRLAQTEVSLVEVGPGADAPDPLDELPDGVRITHEVYEYAPGKFTPYVRMTHDGYVRVRH